MYELKWCPECEEMIPIEQYSEMDCCLMCEKEKQSFLEDMQREYGIKTQYDLSLEGHA